MDMIEKGARAVCKLTYDLMDEDQRSQITAKEYVDRFWKTHIQETIAVIQVMKDPTEDMLNDGFEFAPHTDLPNAYEAMINKALEG